jgi:hypothetical protein
VSGNRGEVEKQELEKRLNLTPDEKGEPNEYRRRRRIWRGVREEVVAGVAGIALAVTIANWSPHPVPTPTPPTPIQTTMTVSNEPSRESALEAAISNTASACYRKPLGLPHD